MVNRLLPLSGIVAVVLLAGAFMLGGNTPSSGASGRVVAGYYLAHHDAQMAVCYAVAIASGFVVLFGVGVWRSQPVGTWRLLFAVGAGVAAAGFLAGAAIHLALVEGVHHQIAPAAAQSLNELDAYDYLPFAIGLAIMLVGAAGLGIPARGFERVLGWSALVIGVAAFTPAGVVAIPLTGIWMIAASIAMTGSAPGEMTTATVVPAHPTAV